MLDTKHQTISPEQPGTYYLESLDPLNPQDNQQLNDTQRWTIHGALKNNAKAVKINVYPADARLVSYVALQEDGADAGVALDQRRISGAASAKGGLTATTIKACTLVDGMSATLNPHALSKKSIRQSLSRASSQPYSALRHAKKGLDEEYIEAIQEQPTGFKLLSRGRLAYSSGNDNIGIFVRDSGGLCQKLPSNDNNVYKLPPGRNAVILVHTEPPDKTRETQAKQISNIIDRTDPYLADAANLWPIAKDILDARDESLPAGMAMISVVDVDPHRDERTRLRRGLDYLRPSTLGYAALSVVTRADIERRALYEQPTTGGRIARGVARSVDVIGGVAGAYCIYSLTRAALAHKGLLAPSHAAPPQPIHEGLGENVTPAEVSSPSPAEQQPTTPTDIYADQRTAYSDDPAASGRDASSVSLWSKQAITYYGEFEGLPSDETNKLVANWGVIHEINEGLYEKNDAVRTDRNHFLNANTTYDVSAQNDAAHKAVLERMNELGLQSKSSAPATDSTAEMPTTPNNDQVAAPIAKDGPAHAAKENSNFLSRQMITAITIGAGSIAAAVAVVKKVKGTKKITPAKAGAGRHRA